MKKQKYTLKAPARVGGQQRDKGDTVELYPDQIERLEQALKNQPKENTHA